MKISLYDTIEEKQKHFVYHQINNTSEFEALKIQLSNLTTQDAGKRVIFRGMHDAKYKLYTSAQREWKRLELDKTGKSFKNFIELQIKEAKTYNNRLLEKFYKSFDQPADDISILSFLQHYGAPTPLLDWTNSFDKALFFGIDGMRHLPPDGIDNYFSIYAIEPHPDLSSILKHIENSVNQIDEIHGLRIGADASIVENVLKQYNYDYLHNLKLFYIPGWSPKSTVFSMGNNLEFKLNYNQHNLNVINQEGLFVFNNDSEHPLEYYFNDEKKDPFHLPKMLCWDIHKNLEPHIKTYLEGKGINKDFIYPQEEQIAQTAFKNCLKKL